MKEALKNEPVTHGGVGLDPSHNDVGRDTNRRSSHIVGRPHSAQEDEKKRAVGYAVGKVYDEIVRSKDHDPFDSIDDTAQEVMKSYPMASDIERAKIEHLVGNFKPTDEPSDDLYDAVYDAMFGGSWFTTAGSREFLEAFATAAKKLNMVSRFNPSVQ